MNPCCLPPHTERFIQLHLSVFLFGSPGESVDHTSIIPHIGWYFKRKLTTLSASPRCLKELPAFLNLPLEILLTVQMSITLSGYLMTAMKSNAS